MNKTVIFDFDGTLADTIGLVMRLYNEHAANFGSDPVDVSEFPTLRKLGYRRALKAKRIHWYVLPRLVAFIRREMRQHMHEVEPYDGIVDMLKALQSNGLSIGVLTSNDASLVQEFFTAHNFPAFNFVVSEKTIFGKDRALNKIVEIHKLDKDSVVYIGDEPRDITSSHKAGVKVIGVAWGLGGRELLEKSNPDLVVDTVAELQQSLLATSD